jgi:hypothetical protein
MVTPMHLPFFLFLFASLALGQGSPKIEIIPQPKTLEDYDHQFKGCLENSECDQVMGLQLMRWNDLIRKLKTNHPQGPMKAQFLEVFRAKYGIPIEFYTHQKSQKAFKPLLFNSPCKDHNLKEGDKVLKGTSFIKYLSAEKALLWRDQSQLEVPVGELIIPQPIIVYDDNNKTTYQAPLGDQPLFIKDKNLYVLKEAEELFYILKISAQGEWKIVDIDLAQLSNWEDKRSTIECPKSDQLKTPKIFGTEFCKQVWDETQKKTLVVKMHQGCSI